MKELVMEVTNALPETATFDDILEAIYVRIKLEKGIKNVQNNETYTTEELIEEIEKWK